MPLNDNYFAIEILMQECLKCSDVYNHSRKTIKVRGDRRVSDYVVSSSAFSRKFSIKANAILSVNKFKIGREKKSL